ncbi:MAG: hypothetical protein SGILL_006611, partial [Bacillariaceae sp.]
SNVNAAQVITQSPETVEQQAIEAVQGTPEKTFHPESSNDEVDATERNVQPDTTSHPEAAEDHQDDTSSDALDLSVANPERPIKPSSKTGMPEGGLTRESSFDLQKSKTAEENESSTIAGEVDGDANRAGKLGPQLDASKNDEVQVPEQLRQSNIMRSDSSDSNESPPPSPPSELKPFNKPGAKVRPVLMKSRLRSRKGVAKKAEKDDAPSRAMSRQRQRQASLDRSDRPLPKGRSGEDDATDRGEKEKDDGEIDEPQKDGNVDAVAEEHQTIGVDDQDIDEPQKDGSIDAVAEVHHKVVDCDAEINKHHGGNDDDAEMIERQKVAVDDDAEIDKDQKVGDGDKEEEIDERKSEPEKDTAAAEVLGLPKDIEIGNKTDTDGEDEAVREELEDSDMPDVRVIAADVGQTVDDLSRLSSKDVPSKNLPSDELPVVSQCAFQNSNGDRCCFEAKSGGFCGMHAETRTQARSDASLSSIGASYTPHELSVRPAESRDYRCIFLHLESGQCIYHTLPGSALCPLHWRLRQNRNISIFDVDERSEENEREREWPSAETHQESDSEDSSASEAGEDGAIETDNESELTISSGEDSTGMYKNKEFKILWQRAEEILGQKTAEIENTHRIRAANAKVDRNDTTYQQKAQYGRLLPNAMTKLEKDILDLKQDDVFLDIGHGIGNTCLHAAFCVGCEL